jgi:5S rRNA maturation endonuclease (ribonuclease M5)
MTISKILTVTRAKKSSSGYIGHCPAHEDANPSLTIAEKDGKVVVHCHRGCSQADVIAALKSHEAWNPAPKEKATPIEYKYTDEAGNHLYSKFRFPEKKWSIGYWKDGELKHGGLTEAGIRRVLYNLQGIEQAKQTGKSVWLVEGEKDANNLIRLGFPATTTDAGAGHGKARPELLESLKDLNVILCGDNDDVGRAYSDELQKSLVAYANTVHRINLPSQMDGKPIKDITDYLDILGHGESSVKSLLEKAKQVYPMKAVYSYGELLNLDLPEPKTWLGGFVAPREATLIVALPGVGKTWFTMAIAQVLADGSHSLGPWKPKIKAKTLIVDFEMSAARIRERLEKIRRGYGLDNTLDDIGILCPELCLKCGIMFNDLGAPEQQRILHDAIKDYDVVVVDNINAAYPNSEDDENSPKFWAGPQALVLALRQLEKAVLFVHHATKGDPKNPAGSGKNVRFFDNVLALCDVTDYSKSDVKRIKVHVRKSRNFPISRETQPELELQDIGQGAFWASVGENVLPQEFRRDVDDYDDNQQAIPF